VFRYSLQHLSETFLILRRNQQDTITNVHRSLSKTPVIIGRFSSNFNFLVRFFENPKILNFMEIHPVEAVFFPWTQTADNMQLIITFHNVTKAPNRIRL